MCGIAGVYLKNKKAATQNGVEAFANTLLLQIEKRGKHATGFASVGWDRSVKLDKAAKPASEFIKDREAFQPDVQCVLLHTRHWTKGKPDETGNNHPVIYNTCFAIHNGSIWNDDELFKEEELERHFQVDSEIIPALLDKHGLDHPDHIKEALEKMGGAMAIAAIDPVRNPSRLLLAKGTSSPLYIFENPNVIIWASTEEAIKEAWGRHIGTPPKTNKIKYTPEGTFFLADDYKELGKYEFSVKKRAAGYSAHDWPGYENSRPLGQTVRRALGRGNATRRERETQIVRPWDSTGLFHSQDQFYDAVKQHRLRTEGKVARRWLLIETYEESDFADVKGNREWFNCICGHGILRQDMTEHAKYGVICIDCYAVILERYNLVSDRGADDPLADFFMPPFPVSDRSNLENHARVEAKAHRYTLQDLSDAAGLSPNAIDYLVFRSGINSTDFGMTAPHVKMRLKAAYDKVFDHIITNLGKELEEEVAWEQHTTATKAQEVAEQAGYPWKAYSDISLGIRRTMYECEAHHEKFPFGEHCLLCQEAEQEFGDSCGVEPFAQGSEDTSRDDNGPLVRCPRCQTWYIGTCPSENCQEAAPKSDNKPSYRCCCTTAGGDRKCRRKLAIIRYIGLIGKPLGYCARHWEKCSSSSCDEDANFTGLDGQRWCHKHARSKNGITDKQAHQEGSEYSITEVK